MSNTFQAIPDGFHGSLLMAAFHLLLATGYTADQSSPDADFNKPSFDDTAPSAPDGFEYACTYGIVDDISPGAVHAYVSKTGPMRIFIGVESPYP